METDSLNEIEAAQTNNIESTVKENGQDIDIKNGVHANDLSNDEDDDDVSSDDSIRLRVSDEDLEIEDDSINTTQSQNTDLRSENNSKLSKEDVKESANNLSPKTSVKLNNRHSKSAIGKSKSSCVRAPLSKHVMYTNRWKYRNQLQAHANTRMNARYVYYPPYHPSQSYYSKYRVNGPNKYYNQRANAYNYNHKSSSSAKRRNVEYTKEKDVEYKNDDHEYTKKRQVKRRCNDVKDSVQSQDEEPKEVSKTDENGINDEEKVEEDPILAEIDRTVEGLSCSSNDDKDINEITDDNLMDELNLSDFKEGEDLSKDDEKLKCDSPKVKEEKSEDNLDDSKLPDVKLMVEEDEENEEEEQKIDEKNEEEEQKMDEENEEEEQKMDEEKKESKVEVECLTSTIEKEELEEKSEKTKEEASLFIQEDYEDEEMEPLQLMEKTLDEDVNTEVATEEYEMIDNSKTDEQKTNEEKLTEIEKMSVEISSENDSENASHSVDSTQDSMGNKEVTNDRTESVEEKSSEDDEDDENDNEKEQKDDDKSESNLEENNDEQNANESIEEESLQSNIDSDETQMEMELDKRDDSQLIDEVEIEENTENQIDLSDININEEDDKNDSSTTNKSMTVRVSSPTSLKRNMSMVNGESTNKERSSKKPKMDTDDVILETDTCRSDKPPILPHLREVFVNNATKLKQLSKEELLDLILQKVAEAITMHSEIGQLKAKLEIADKNQEAMKVRCQQYAKQLKDFEMVLKRNEMDRKTSGDKYVAPIKINRSVGLQVALLSDHGFQSLRQVQNAKSSLANANSTNRPLPTINGQRRIKVHSPRRIATSTTSLNTSVQSPQTIAVTPSVNLATATTAVVVTKATELPQISRTMTLPNNNVRNTVTNTNQISPKITHVQPKHVVINGAITSPSNRQHITTLNVQNKSNDLIDLTDEEDKKKAPNRGPTIVTQTITQPTIISDTLVKQHTIQTPSTQTHGNTRYQRVIQTIPGSIINQTNNIRVVQPANQLTPTGLVSNSSPRLTYIMPTAVGQGRQVLITNSNQIRPVNANGRNQYSTVTYKTNVSNAANVTNLQNGTVTRILTNQACTNIQIPKHPAPLPVTPPCEMNPLWKLPPPAPSLKISKMGNGIILSWTMSLNDRYEDIASYQLFAYQEVAGAAPSTALWKKVGDVRSLPLPMACTLTQFAAGNNYHFAVRAVDKHSRLGQYSQPGNISL